MFNKNTNASPIPYAGPANRAGFSNMFASNDNETYMRTMGSAGTVFQIVSLLASSTAAAEWRLYRKAKADGRVRYTTGDQGSDQRTEVLQHLALNVWNRPNPFYTGRRFREASQQHAELTGEQWWVIARDSRATFPTGMWLVRPDRMEPVPSAEKFIAGYVQAALEFNVEYTPVVGGVPSLFLGGAAFPGNDWTVDTRGEDYLSRIPSQSHPALGKIRAFHLRATREVLRRLDHHDNRWHGDVVSFSCDNSQRT